MVRRLISRPFNLELYKKRSREISGADTSGTPESLFARVGAITSAFEACESAVWQVFANLTPDRSLMALLFNHINNRSTRVQILEEYLETTKPRRATKRYTFAADCLKRYKFLGARRDEVAHSTLANWDFEGRKILLLEPAWHVERKRVAGLPKYHYDSPSLEKLIKELQAFHAEMNAYLLPVFQRNTQRLVKRQERVDARTREKTAPLSQR